MLSIQINICAGRERVVQFVQSKLIESNEVVLFWKDIMGLRTL